MNIPRDFLLLKNQILSKEFFWVLGFFSAEGSVILEKTKQSFRLVFDIFQKCTLEKKDRFTELLASYGFVFSFSTKKGVSHWRIRKKEEAYFFSTLLLTYRKWLCPKKREKVKVSLQCLNCALMYFAQSLGCEEKCYWALGVWEGDGGVSISYNKKQEIIKTLQIRIVQKLEPNSTSRFPQLLVLFQQVLKNCFTRS